MLRQIVVFFSISLLATGCDTAPATYQPAVTGTPQSKASPVTPLQPPALSPAPKQTEEPKKETKPNCDSNYSGCVPIASDVDCDGGRGNGPAYVRGPVNVIGSDVYGLDRDGDGVACE